MVLKVQCLHHSAMMWMSALTSRRHAQVESREDTPALLEGTPLSEIDPVMQLAQQLNACALDNGMATLIKPENMPSPSRVQV